MNNLNLLFNSYNPNNSHFEIIGDFLRLKELISINKFFSKS
jgi:hypothetical protein